MDIKECVGLGYGLLMVGMYIGWLYGIMSSGVCIDSDIDSDIDGH